MGKNVSRVYLAVDTELSVWAWSALPASRIRLASSGWCISLSVMVLLCAFSKLNLDRMDYGSKARICRRTVAEMQ